MMTVARGGVEPPTSRFSVGRSYQLSYLAEDQGMVSAARKGAVHGLFFGLGAWVGMLLISNYDFVKRVKRL